MAEDSYYKAKGQPISLSEKETGAFIRASQAILGSESFEKTARLIFDEVIGVIGAKAGYVALLSDNGEENEVLFLEAGGDPCNVDPNLPMPVRGLRAEAYRENVTVYDNDFQHGDYVEFMPEGHVEMINVMFAPLSIKDKVVGVIGIANKNSDFTSRDADIASLFGKLAAIALQNSRNLEKLTLIIEQLENTSKEVKHLQGIIPICSRCKQIRDDHGLWNQLEQYLTEHSDALFSHSYCPKCTEELEKQIKERFKK